MQQRRNLDLDTRGYYLADEVLSGKRFRDIERALPDTESSGTRKLLEIESFLELSREIRTNPSTMQVLEGLIPIQGIYFRKNRDHNWSLKFHRDSIIPIKGTGPWKSAGNKDGFNNVHAPFEFIERCVAVRVALDDCEDGDLRVVPGSHLNQSIEANKNETVVKVPKGHALVLRPNLLHGSSKLVSSVSRRVLHFLYAPSKPPHSYRWYHAA